MTGPIADGRDGCRRRAPRGSVLKGQTVPHTGGRVDVRADRREVIRRPVPVRIGLIDRAAWAQKPGNHRFGDRLILRRSRVVVRVRGVVLRLNRCFLGVGQNGREERDQRKRGERPACPVDGFVAVVKSFNWPPVGRTFYAFEVERGTANCRRLFRHEVRRAASRADCTAGSNRLTKTPMIAMTTKSSIRVKPVASPVGVGLSNWFSSFVVLLSEKC